MPFLDLVSSSFCSMLLPTAAAGSQLPVPKNVVGQEWLPVHGGSGSTLSVAGSASASTPLATIALRVAAILLVVAVALYLAWRRQYGSTGGAGPGAGGGYLPLLPLQGLSHAENGTAGGQGSRGLQGRHAPRALPPV